MRIYIVGLASQNLCTLLAAVPDSDIVGETAELAPSQEAIKTAKACDPASRSLVDEATQTEGPNLELQQAFS
jgi:hypothetical protein